MAEFKVEDEFSLSKEDQLSRMASFASGSGFSSSNSIPRPRSYESNDGDGLLDEDDETEALKAGSHEDKMVSALRFVEVLKSLNFPLLCGFISYEDAATAFTAGLPVLPHLVSFHSVTFFWL
jgi:hypothetical protein